MTIIGIKEDGIYTKNIEMKNGEYLVDLSRNSEGLEEGAVIISGMPFPLPLELEIAIKKDGSFSFREWKLHGTWNTGYFHLVGDHEGKVATREQIDTVAGLSSGRIKFEGIKLSLGASVFKLCPIDIEEEEKKSGKKLYLA